MTNELTPEVIAAAERLKRVDDGETVGSVYGVPWPSEDREHPYHVDLRRILGFALSVIATQQQAAEREKPMTELTPEVIAAAERLKSHQMFRKDCNHIWNAHRQCQWCHSLQRDVDAGIVAAFVAAQQQQAAEREPGARRRLGVES